MPEQKDSIRRGLPRGRNALDREAVAASQQARLLEAICELTAREGYVSITVNKLIARAGVAKPTFYEHFESKEDCLFVWLDRAVEQLIDAITAELEPGATTEERIRHGVTAVVEFMAADEDRARSMLVECFAAGGSVQVRIDQAYEQLAHFYQALREESRIVNPDEPPMSIVRARAIVGAIKDPLAGVLRDGDVDGVRSICDEVVDGVTLLATGHHGTTH
ncbi:MAG: TetR/AcrR family transcriptional regulator [Thermoleophilaceae bacterium]|nr:TetR/AcrR family transcriptional regulator [Thermoleophilaceae bacterium]